MQYKFLPSFVQRKGRITKSQEHNLLQLSKFEINSCDQIVSEKEDFKKVILEIGFGNGEHISRLAKENQQHLYIGSEVYMSGIGQLLGEITKYNLNNIKIVKGDIRLLLDDLKSPLFDDVVIICPDPWPKLKHHKRRMINLDFFELIHKSINPNGHLFISTDWENYAESIEETIDSFEGFKRANGSIYEDTFLTKFQQRAKKEGRKIYPFALEKIS